MNAYSIDWSFSIFRKVLVLIGIDWLDLVQVGSD